MDMRLDADEMLTPILCDELSKLMSEHDCDEANGIIIETKLFFMGKEIKHGCHNKRKLKLFKTGFGRSEQRNVDEHNILLSGTSIYSKNKFIHFLLNGLLCIILPIETIQLKTTLYIFIIMF